MRQMCPVTCGCHDPSSGLVLSRPERGCSQACVSMRNPQWNATMSEKTCTDDDEKVSRYVNGFALYNQAVLGSNKVIAEGIIAHINKSSGSCERVGQPIKVRHYTLDLCEYSESLSFGSLKFICPVACDCISRPREGCPVQCDNAWWGDLLIKSFLDPDISQELAKIKNPWASR